MNGLTKEALAERRKGIGGSDAAKIIEGGEAWYRLWLDKTGRSEPEDLSGVFAVQLGLVTEALNLDWCERSLGDKVIRRGEVCVSKEHPILRCTLDGWNEWRVIQAKHVGAFQKLPEVTERYRPQVCHECIVTGAEQGILSVIVGTNEPALIPIELDPFWALEYIDRCHEFWEWVRRDKEPPGAPPAAAPPIPVERMRVVDFQGNNGWSDAAARWLDNRKPADRFKAAEKDIKALVEADVRLATGHGIEVKRDGRGLKIGEAK